MPAPKLLIISATRAGAGDFVSATLLGRSVHRLRTDTRLEVQVAVDNKAGLPAIYNKQVSDENRGKILLFVHDDVLIDDFFLYERLDDALKVFDVAGVAGNLRRLAGQPGWGFVNEAPFTRDEARYLSGVIGHGEAASANLSRYGAAGQPCELLDGVFLAARCDTLLDSGVRFDERFLFDFYDLDFCRSARAAKLRCGTWPVAITHRSRGQFGDAWREGLAAYRAKWGD